MSDTEALANQKTPVGRWKACSFLLVYSAVEMTIYFGIGANLVIYLTSVMHEGTVNASKNVNNWAGVCWITPLIGAFLGDTVFGRYWTFVVFAFCYIMGSFLLNITVWLPSLRPPPCGIGESCQKASDLQVGIFYLALYIIAIGAGATKPNVVAIGADQFDELIEEEKQLKGSYYNWWCLAAFAGTLIGQTIIVYVQDNVGFKWGYGILAIAYVVAVCCFLGGTIFYRRPRITSNPYKEMAQVIFAAIKKRSVQVPSDSSQLYEVDHEFYASQGRVALPNTNSVRCLDKAATKHESQDTGPWSLCPVTQVEEMKSFIKLIPILLCNFVPNLMVSNMNTLFVKQATTLDTKIGNFEIPAASLGALFTVPMMITVVAYDRLVATRLKSREIGMFKRIFLGLGVQTLAMVVASITESRRMHMVTEHGLLGNDKVVIPSSVFILAPQFILFGISIAMIEPAFLQFFYEEAPERMKSTCGAFFFVSIGVGFFLSSFLLTLIQRITDGKWIRDNLNSSKLHYYYAFLVGLCSLNLALLVVLSKQYTFTKQN